MSHKTYSLQKSDSKQKPWLIVVLVLLIVLILAAGLWLTIFRQPKVVQLSASPPTSTNKYLSLQGKYLFSGTIMLGRAVEKYANGDYNQPFSGMNTLGQYDASIGVLECPVTSNNVSYQTQVDKLIFNCQPQWLPTLKQHFPIINLSSNHLNDMGPDGYAETVKRLDDAGFQVVGNFNPHAEKDDCKSVVIPVHLQKSSGSADKALLPVAICSYNYKSLFKPEPGELESIQKWSKLMPVIALMNGGPEYQHHAGADQISVAHKMIDYGAEFVVGDGTHWVQNTEVYKGKLIEYSMGNFIFDQLDYDGRIALNLSAAMTVRYDNNVSRWLKVGNTCQSTTTDCLGLATTQGLRKINTSFKFDVVGSYGGFQRVTTKANDQQQNDIEQRANWSDTQQLLAE